MIKGKISNIGYMVFDIKLPEKYIRNYMSVGGVGSVIRQIHNQLKKVGKMSFDKLWVKSESYSGGSSVNIYLLNPSKETYKDSKNIMSLFEYGSFNPMIDLYEYSPKDSRPLLVLEDGKEIEVDSKYNFSYDEPPFGSKEYDEMELVGNTLNKELN